MNLETSARRVDFSKKDDGEFVVDNAGGTMSSEYRHEAAEHPKGRPQDRHVK